jgi:hypothetical protein
MANIYQHSGKSILWLTATIDFAINNIKVNKDIKSQKDFVFIVEVSAIDSDARSVTLAAFSLGSQV